MAAPGEREAANYYVVSVFRSPTTVYVMADVNANNLKPPRPLSNVCRYSGEGRGDDPVRDKIASPVIRIVRVCFCYFTITIRDDETTFYSLGDSRALYSAFIAGRLMNRAL